MSQAAELVQRVLAPLSVAPSYLQLRVWSCTHASCWPFVQALWNSVLATDRSWSIPRPW